jgi:hypothetical protein
MFMGFRPFTLSLIRALEGDGVCDVGVDVLIDLAFRNKVLLHLLKVLDVQGPLREQQELSMRRVTEVVQTISKLLKGYDYAFFKLVKPLSYVPADIDILVDANQIGKVVHEIVGLGYNIVVKDPYCITLTRGDSIIDLYVHPSLGGVIFIDGQRLLEHRCLMEFNGAEIISLESYVEALVSAAHAIYKERIYTLNDYFTVKEWATEETFKLAKKLRCTSSLNLVVKINEVIEKGLIEAPYKIPVTTWAKLLVRKIVNDPLTRSTSKNLVSSVGSMRGLKLLRSKFTRETY